jgi:hypothetical protein
MIQHGTDAAADSRRRDALAALLWGVRWLLVLFVVLEARPADACATAPPVGEEARIAEEEAVIVWDPASRTEHFIRRATFVSTAGQFGFLVPTPTTPQLSEVSDSLFTELAKSIEAPIRYERSYKLGSWFATCMLKGADKSAPAASGVRVLGTANVAGFDATTLEADDAKALGEWLGQHGFAETQQLTTWLERYVANHWKVTAFVVASAAGEAPGRYGLATRAVKMSFQTDRPFYPYREPQGEAPTKLGPLGDRMLRLFFVSTERYAATLADEPWSAKVILAAPLELELAELPAVTPSFLTVFIDDSSPRRGTDELFFGASTDRSVVRQPVRVIEDDDHAITIPVDMILIVVVIAVVVSRRWRSRAAARKQPRVI